MHAYSRWLRSGWTPAGFRLEAEYIRNFSLETERTLQVHPKLVTVQETLIRTRLQTNPSSATALGLRLPAAGRVRCPSGASSRFRRPARLRGRLSAASRLTRTTAGERRPPPALARPSREACRPPAGPCTRTDSPRVPGGRKPPPTAGGDLASVAVLPQAAAAICRDPHFCPCILCGSSGGWLQQTQKSLSQPDARRRCDTDGPFPPFQDRRSGGNGCTPRNITKSIGGGLSPSLTP
ncbi:uncharacterized protein WM294_001187 [Sarcoramphus papa]